MRCRLVELAGQFVTARAKVCSNRGRIEIWRAGIIEILDDGSDEGIVRHYGISGAWFGSSPIPLSGWSHVYCRQVSYIMPS